MEILAEAEGLKKTYGTARALEDLSFSVGAGEIVGLLGANGAGKTTAIHILLGLLEPSGGRARVFGLDPLKSRHEIAARMNFSSAYVQLPSNLKVTENLSIYARLYGVPDAKRRIPELLELFDIAKLSGRVTGALSSGEKTRLNLAKAMLNRPKLLLLDEPTASLDPEMADTVRGVLKLVQRRDGIGMLYTSHNMPEVEAICDRVVFLNEGRVIARGTPAEVMKAFDSPSLERVFIKIVRGNVVAENRP